MYVIEMAVTFSGHESAKGKGEATEGPRQDYGESYYPGRTAV